MASREFGVHGVATADGDMTEVIGRCFRGPISVGDCFTGVRSVDAQSRRPVGLRVIRIEAYGQSLPELDEGLTGRLLLQGSPDPLVLDGSVLFTE